MISVKVHEAKTNLSKLIEQACRGEEIIIARGATPVVRLVPVGKVRGRRQPGALRGSWLELPGSCLMIAGSIMTGL